MVWLLRIYFLFIKKKTYNEVLIKLVAVKRVCVGKKEKEKTTKISPQTEPNPMNEYITFSPALLTL